ncbi:surface-adhesin E family protein [Phenylobacterium sp.]|uniref:surface-adhesin E family protein n=1 Tax=Phenylobacterium sp. TaxID=1871053 RepID=UPI0035231217
MEVAMRIVILAMLIGLSAWAGAAAAQDTRWASAVRADGWPPARLTSDGDMLIYRRPAPAGPEGYPRLQLRYEYRDGEVMGGKRYLSMLSLDEYDCRGGRFRNLRVAVFAGHNAEGQSIQPPDATDPWAKPQPGTVDGKSLEIACAKR